MMLLSSCSKNESSIPPAISKVNVNSSGSITINNLAYAKSADIFATQIENRQGKRVYHSSFSVGNNQSSGSLAVNIATPENELEKGDYIMSSERNTQASVTYISNGVSWKSDQGHQKGSTFKVLSSRDLQASSGYVKEAMIQVNCALYNAKGDFIPFQCITHIKF